jgi:hypothetical protein
MHTLRGSTTLSGTTSWFVSGHFHCLPERRPGLTKNLTDNATDQREFNERINKSDVPPGRLFLYTVGGMLLLFIVGMVFVIAFMRLLLGP